MHVNSPEQYTNVNFGDERRNLFAPTAQALPGLPPCAAFLHILRYTSCDKSSIRSKWKKCLVAALFVVAKKQ
jgi:hypothetical protein